MAFYFHLVYKLLWLAWWVVSGVGGGADGRLSTVSCNTSMTVTPQECSGTPTLMQIPPSVAQATHRFVPTPLSSVCSSSRVRDGRLRMRPPNTDSYPCSNYGTPKHIHTVMRMYIRIKAHMERMLENKMEISTFIPKWVTFSRSGAGQFGCRVSAIFIDEGKADRGHVRAICEPKQAAPRHWQLQPAKLWQNSCPDTSWDDFLFLLFAFITL